MDPHPALSREKMATSLIRAPPELCRRLAAALAACHVMKRLACRRRCGTRIPITVQSCAHVSRTSVLPNSPWDVHIPVPSAAGGISV